MSNRDSYLYANFEIMMMPGKAALDVKGEDWGHLLAKYPAEAEIVAKAGKKAVLPPEAPAFLKYGQGCRVGRQVTEGSVVSEDVAIVEGVMIKKSLVAPKCTVGKNAKIVNSIIQKGAVIGDG